MINKDRFNKIEGLFLKFFNKETSEDEDQYLHKWLSESDVNLKLFEDYKYIWDSLALMNEENSIEPHKELITVMSGIKKNKRSFVKKLILYTSSAAACIVIFFSIFNLIHPVSGIIENQNYITTVNVPNGELKQVVLQDGTRVWLNAGSSLSYNSWEKSSDREVYVKGRAYFEVTKDSLKPFMVKTDNVNIKVVGTKFNVDSFDNCDIVETTVIEGCVALSDKKGNLKKKGVSVTLKKNSQATYIRNTKSFVISEVDANIYRQWTNGILVFKEKRFADIAKELERQFNVKISVKDDVLNNYTFTATFEKGKKIEDILNAFSLTYPLSYKINNQSITINNKIPMNS